MRYRKTNPKKFSNALKISSASIELLMSIPGVSWMIVITTGLPIFIGLLFHTLSLIIASKAKTKILGNVLGIFASFLAVFPVLGWLLHVITATVLLVDVIKNRKSENSRVATQEDY